MPSASVKLSVRADRIVANSWFQRLIVLAILLAGALAGIETNGALVDRHGAALRVLDSLVLWLFIAEIVLKLAAHGRKPWQYFNDGWNVFDFIIVVVCCLPLHSQFAAVLRLARGLRLLRLVSALPKLQLLAGALLKSLGAMGYVSLLLGLMFYIYAVAGVHLFAAHAPQYFGTLGITLLSLFQIITLDNWTDILNAVRPAVPVFSIIYFVSFVLLGTMIMLNLFIGIIMNSMSEMHADIEGREHERKIEAGEILSDPSRALEAQIAELRGLVNDLSRVRGVRRADTSAASNRGNSSPRIAQREAAPRRTL